METLELLKRLTSAYGVSGSEEGVTAVIKELLEPLGEVNIDHLNNVTCSFGEGYHFMLDAHIDEIGLIVKNITDGGFLKVSNLGGVDRRMLLGYEVDIHGTANGKQTDLRGVISTLPPHLQNDGDSKKAPELKDISIDTGFTKAEVERYIQPGDRATFRRNFTTLLGTRLSSSVLDDRCGVAAIILAAYKLKDVNAKITVLCSSQEEVGGRGASIAPYGRDVDEAIAVDVTFADSPLCSHKDLGELGKGAMVGFSPVLDKTMSNKLIEVAKKNNIPYQTEVMGGRSTGTNADEISLVQSGIRTGLLSIPERYMHSPAETIDIKDVEYTAELIAAYVRERAGEINA